MYSAREEFVSSNVLLLNIVDKVKSPMLQSMHGSSKSMS